MRPRRLLLYAIVVLGIGPPPAVAANTPTPTARDAALLDGCQRSEDGIIFDTSPQWVYVGRNPAIRAAQGVVRVAHASLQDSILEHSSYDFAANLVPDPRYRYLIAGIPAAHTNNFAPGGEGHGRLHFAWESATLPRFAWPTDGDRATIWGSWVWNCASWQSGGAITGEPSELHPLNAIAVNRRSAYMAVRGENQTDVFVSNQGDAAHAVEQCALVHQPVAGSSPPQYDAGFGPCAVATANRIQPLARSYSFFVPAPPRPSRKSRLRYRIINRAPGGSGSQRVHKRGNGIDVTVTLPAGAAEVRYGKTFLVSWSKPQRQPPIALKVTLRSLVINQADPSPALPDPTGAHWNLYLDVNGYWQLLNSWLPDLSTNVVDGQRFTIDRTIRIFVPQGSGVWFQIAGRECDEPAGQVVLGVSMNMLFPCPANTDELSTDIRTISRNDDPGTILDVYGSVAAALGTHTSSSAAVTSSFPGSGTITFGDGNQGQADYQLTYTIQPG
jgi:hypothetical protein